jgi:high-affinity Fe2+/Pb2+ permease
MCDRTIDGSLTATIVFFICFRECLETSIIVSVLLAFLKQTLGPKHDAAIHKKLVRQVHGPHDPDRIVTKRCHRSGQVSAQEYSYVSSFALV